MTTGECGEKTAAVYLALKGYSIIEKNYRCRGGEIDIIARKNGFLVFAEVKTRAPGAMVSGAQSVDYHKRRRLITAAKLYLASHDCAGLQPRFDFISVIKTRFAYRVEQHIENAFGE